MKHALISVLALGLLSGLTAVAADAPARAHPLPVMLDTDIGDDIDDTWAIAMLLKSPQFEVKLVTTTAGKAEYRAKLVAKLLQTAGRSDIPVGLGAGGRDGVGAQQAWVENYSLKEYPGKVLEDGVQAVIDLANAQERAGQPLTIIAIGPLHTLGEALTRQPELARKAHFVGMHGSVRKGYDNNPTPCVEYNMTHVPGAQRVFAAPWRSATITPLDTCGLVRLTGDTFLGVRQSTDPLIQALVENYRIWAKKAAASELTASSILFDTVAVYLALPGAKPLIKQETLPIRVDDKGMTLIDPAGAKMAVGTDWADLAGYHQFLARVLQSPTVPAPAKR